MAARLIVAGKLPMMRGWTGRESCPCPDCVFALQSLHSSGRAVPRPDVPLGRGRRRRTAGAGGRLEPTTDGVLNLRASQHDCRRRRSSVEMLQGVFDNVSTVSSYILVAVLIPAGLYFTISTGVVQVRLLPEMFRTLVEPGGRDSEGNRNISPFRA